MQHVVQLLELAIELEILAEQEHLLLGFHQLKDRFQLLERALFESALACQTNQMLHKFFHF